MGRAAAVAEKLAAEYSDPDYERVAEALRTRSARKGRKLND
jgi:hypothetical protein